MAEEPQEESQVKGKKVGKVAHYFGKIMVAVIDLEAGSLKVGDQIQIVDKDGSVVLEQTIESMQVDKESIEEAKVGEPFGMKVVEPVKEGLEVYKVE